MKIGSQLGTKFAVWAVGLLLAGCDGFPRDLNREPTITPINTVAMPEIIPEKRKSAPTSPLATNSTWNDRAANLYSDARAIRSGDVLTVKISINDKAEFDNSSNRTRDNKYTNQGAFDFALSAFGLAPKPGNGSLNVANESVTNTQASGSNTRAETINLLVGATVMEILPNGNLLIKGQQEVRLNYEMRVLTVEGIVRARDISTDNTVSYEKIAEARISYGGKGRTMEVLQPPVGQQILDRIAPF